MRGEGLARKEDGGKVWGRVFSRLIFTSGELRHQVRVTFQFPKKETKKEGELVLLPAAIAHRPLKFPTTSTSRLSPPHSLLHYSRLSPAAMKIFAFLCGSFHWKRAKGNKESKKHERFSLRPPPSFFSPRHSSKSLESSSSGRVRWGPCDRLDRRGRLCPRAPSQPPGRRCSFRTPPRSGR